MVLIIFLLWSKFEVFPVFPISLWFSFFLQLGVFKRFILALTGALLLMGPLAMYSTECSFFGSYFSKSGSFRQHICHPVITFKVGKDTNLHSHSSHWLHMNAIVLYLLAVLNFMFSRLHVYYIDWKFSRTHKWNKANIQISADIPEALSAPLTNKAMGALQGTVSNSIEWMEGVVLHRFVQLTVILNLCSPS